MTPLDRFARLIAATGPISLAHYIAESNARYYNSRDPLGRGGDFVTAPEVSQMFGELIGVWLADVWQRSGAPVPVHYVELGPGRGTLARDALRTMARFGLAPEVHCVEASRTLGAIQRAALPGAVIHADCTTLPQHGALLVVANEFFDALPVRQLVRTPAGWRERMVGFDGARLVPVAGQAPMDAAVPARWAGAADGAIIETCPAAAALAGDLAARLVAQGGAALIIDYGHAEPQLGSTLQAVRAHAKVDPFAHPGEADLTAHVDFAALGAAATARGARVSGTITQGALLTALGIGARVAALQRAHPAEAEAIAAAAHRLAAAAAMGTLFKAQALAAPGWADGAGFAGVAERLRDSPDSSG